IIMTGHGDERIAVEMMKLGAKDYLVKDDTLLEILPQVLRNVLNQLSMEQKLALAKAALLESEKRFRLIFNSGTDAVLLNEATDGKIGLFIEVNEIACKRLGYTRDDLLQLSLTDIEDPEWRKEHPVQKEELFEKNRLLYEMIHVSKVGKKIPVEVNSHLIDFAGKPAVISVSRDITERKQLEEQLRQAQKMEAIGKLAGGVAHDFNNLLTTINGYAELLLLKLAVDSPFREGVKKIKKAGEKAASLTQQLLTFSRKQVLQPRQLDLSNLTRGMEKMLKRIIGDDIALQLELEPALMPVKADHDQLEQIIINLAVNAGDAMDNGGRLTIKTENCSIDEYYSSLLPDSRPGKFVCLSISDSGEGIDDKTIQYIFEPFYSTKKIGTGLGLSVVYGIVKQHNGWINVFSKPGKGTIFRIYFPALSTDGTTAAQDTATLTGPQGNGEKILLVDDEESSRKNTAVHLRNHGYEVNEVINAGEALEIFKSKRENFHLCFTNTELPDRSGRELVEALLALAPGLKVLFTSGYSAGQLRDLDGAETKYAFLQKPHSLADLLNKIKAVLA
ncbi:MAG: ATP-binding protein, partial [Candidatus Aminicenantes bacterium]|nr:ATP-binding protein [Candidatus Aminicenantes bacterium]